MRILNCLDCGLSCFLKSFRNGLERVEVHTWSKLLFFFGSILRGWLCFWRYSGLHLDLDWLLLSCLVNFCLFLSNRLDYRRNFNLLFFLLDDWLSWFDNILLILSFWNFWFRHIFLSWLLLHAISRLSQYSINLWLGWRLSRAFDFFLSLTVSHKKFKFKFK